MPKGLAFRESELLGQRGNLHWRKEEHHTEQRRQRKRKEDWIE
jgi:hypothetical protein